MPRLAPVIRMTGSATRRRERSFGAERDAAGFAGVFLLLLEHEDLTRRGGRRLNEAFLLVTLDDAEPLAVELRRAIDVADRQREVRETVGLNHARASPNQTDQVQEENRSSRRDDDRPDQAVGVEAEQAEHEPAEQRSDDADDEIAEETEAAPAHDLAREPAGENADENLCDEIHGLVVGRWSLVVGRWLLVVGRWSLVVGRWSLVVGRWPLVVGRWSLILGRPSSSMVVTND